MTTYEMVYIVTSIIYVFSINKLFETFFYKLPSNKKVKNVLLVLYYIVLVGSIFVTRIPIIMMGINMFFLVLVSLCYKSTMKKKVLAVSLMYSIVIIIELIISILFGFFSLSGMKDSEVDSIIALICNSITTVTIVHLISKWKYLLNKDLIIYKRYYMAFFVVLFGTFVMFIMLLENKYLTIGHILMNSSILISVNFTMIVIDEKIYQAILSGNEKKMLEQQNIAMVNQMELINQSTESIRIMKHDFKNHLITLRYMYSNDKWKEYDTYMNHLVNEIEQKGIVSSNNFVIDSIINFKFGKEENKLINLEIDISVPEELHIHPHELTAVVGNLIDNAIYACKETLEKVITIHMSTRMRNLIIHISNSYNGDIVVENEKLITTKECKVNHGLGIMSVEKILEMHGGELLMEYDDNIFSVTVVLPYEMDKI
ncbi:MAG: GHKL domain-containing protein [Eubacteriales bacterium]